MPLLDNINKPNDIKKIPESSLKELAVEIRRLLIKSAAKNGGHLASNLGIVELTIALHRYLNLPKDKLIWDVGHQSYVHKILTGRKDRFDSLRKLDGKETKATVMLLEPVMLQLLFQRHSVWWLQGTCGIQKRK